MSEEIILRCPHCPTGKQAKLYINIDKGLFNCYRCGYKGRLRSLYKHPKIISALEASISLAEYAKLKSFKPLDTKNVEVLSEMNPVREIYYEDPQYNYLISRGWSEDLINIYRPLVSANPKYSDRVILPVIENDVIIYYTARSMDPESKLKYKNPDGVSRKNIVFTSLVSESVLYPNDLVICEGIFDAFKIPNAIGLLGKTISTENESRILELAATKKDIYVALDCGAEISIDYICRKLLNWFPNKRIHKIDTSKYGSKDLGDLAKELSSIELLSWIKSNSIDFKPNFLADNIRNRIFSLAH